MQAWRYIRQTTSCCGSEDDIVVIAPQQFDQKIRPLVADLRLGQSDGAFAQEIKSTPPGGTRDL